MKNIETMEGAMRMEADKEDETALETFGIHKLEESLGGLEQAVQGIVIGEDKTAELYNIIKEFTTRKADGKILSAIIPWLQSKILSIANQIDENFSLDYQKEAKKALEKLIIELE